jgi:uncharacterized protein
MNIHAAQILAFLALLLSGLSLNVSRLRLRHKVSYGDGGHKDLLVAVRAHGNALEQSLLFGALLLALEARHGVGVGVIPALGLTFMTVRLLHVLAIFRRWLLLRQAAHIATLAAQLVTVFALLR